MLPNISFAFDILIISLVSSYLVHEMGDDTEKVLLHACFQSFTGVEFNNIAKTWLVCHPCG